MSSEIQDPPAFSSHDRASHAVPRKHEINPDKYTVGWICALPLEMAAAKAMLENVHPNPLDQDPADHIRLGDILSLESDKFERTGSLNAPPNVLLSALSRLQAEHYTEDSRIPEFLGQLSSKAKKIFRCPDVSSDCLFKVDYPHASSDKTCEKCNRAQQVERGEREDTDPVIHYGTIASGDKVIKNGRLRDQLGQELGALCVEMEAAGLQDFPCIVIRGICDYSDSHKNDAWQPYASMTAAAFAKELLHFMPPSRVLQERPAQQLVSIATQQLQVSNKHYNLASEHLVEHRRTNQILEDRPIDLYVVHKARYDSADVGDSPRCEKNTRIRIQQTIMEWADEDKGQPFLWVFGPAGTGKSTLIRSIADIFHQRKRLAAGYFFKRGEQGRNDTNRLFSTLAMQIADTIPAFKDILRTCLGDMDKESMGKKELRAQFVKLLKDPLAQLPPPTANEVPKIIVLDALDECERPEHLSTILTCMSELCSNSAASLRLRFLLASRQNPQITHAIEPLQKRGVIQELQLHKVFSEETKTDIRHYLQANFEMIRVRAGIQQHPWPSHQHVDHLVELATHPEPLFIYAATLIRFVYDEHNHQDPKTQLESWIDQSVESKSQLHQLYDPILGQIFKLAKDTNFNQRLNFLGALVLVAMPLSSSAIASLLSLDTDRINWWLRGFHAVLDIPSDPNKPIWLLHKSFSDFLLSDEDSFNGHFHISSTEIHSLLADGCLNLMTERLKRNICGMRRLDASPEDVHKDVLSRCIPLELEYACTYWIHHLQVGGRPHDQIYTFVREHFLHWLEALSFLKRVPDGLKAIQSLNSLLKTFSDTPPDLTDLLEDCNRTLLAFAYIIETAPLQAYASLLFFSPLNSRLRQQFWAERLPLSVHIDGTKSDWNGHFQTLKTSRLISTVSYSPDGKYLASTFFDDDSFRIWNASTGTPLVTHEVNSLPSTAVVFSPDSRYLAVGYQDGTVRIWDSTIWTQLRTIKCSELCIDGVMLSSTSHLLSATLNGKVLLWHVKTGELTKTIDCSRGCHPYFTSVAFTPNLRFVAWASFKMHEIQVWNLDDNTFEWTLSVRDPLSIIFSPNNRILACMWSHKVEIRSTSTGELVYAFDACGGRTSMAFSSDGQFLALIAEHNIRLCDMTTYDYHDLDIKLPFYASIVALSLNNQVMAIGLANREIQIWGTTYAGRQSLYDGPVSQHLVLLSPNHKFVVSATESSSYTTLRLWNVSTGMLQRTLGDEHRFFHVHFSPDSESLAWQSSSTHSFIWYLDDGTKQHFIEPNWKRKASHVEYSPNGQLAAVCWARATIELHDSNTGTLIHTLQKYDTDIHVLTFSPDSHVLALSTRDEIHLWNVHTATLQGRFRLRQSRYAQSHAIVFSPSGKTLALQRDTNIVLWDMETGNREESPELLDSDSEFAFTSDFHLLAIGGADEENWSVIKIHIYEVGAWDFERVLHGHQGYIIKLDFLPASRILAVASDDRTVCLWDVMTQSLLHTFNTYNAVPRMIRFSNSGHIMAVESKDRTVRLWNTTTGKFVHMIQYDNGFMHRMDISSETLVISLSNASSDGFWDPWGALNCKLRTHSYPLPGGEQAIMPEPGYCGTNVNADGSWLMVDSKKLVWIPPEYRREEHSEHRGKYSSWAKSEGVVFIGCSSGRMIQLKHCQ
ncbi:vegetative incompatibility het-e-1 [Fusarium longipes]|uniref:Vegetative incompatibility het-e-1 n=1 Tax=Fusarium longipes TaxID=694270 RepID=A0A395SVN3_9HYPO|nr:vegetative incompatibility het-e-1 [Fusarium longipes]